MSIAMILQARGTCEVISCQCDETVMDVIAKLGEKRIGALPVMQDDKIVGIFSERDVIYHLRDDGESVLHRPIKEVMTADPVTVSSDTTALAALSLMTKRRICHLPVVDGDTIAGFISIGDLVKYRIEKIESEAAAMRDYIQAV